MPEHNLQMPMAALRGAVSFPTTVTTFDVGRGFTVAAVEKALEQDHQLLLITQRTGAEHPHMADLYQVGTVVKIKQCLRLPDGTIRVFSEGVGRAILTGVRETGDYQLAELFLVPVVKDEIEEEKAAAYLRLLKTRALQLIRLRGAIGGELQNAIKGEADADTLCELLAANLLEEVGDKQAILECAELGMKLEAVLKRITRECAIGKLESKIAQRVHEAMDKNNHDFYLREQINAIQEELGEDDEDISELKRQLDQSPISGEPRDKTERELKRLIRMTMHSPDAGTSYNYVEYMLSFPWGKTTDSGVDIRKAREVLEADHYGMRDVKDRLLEYLGVRALNPEMKSPILCLVGPPGVGKTSIARSVARALGRGFAQMSLGGVRDEAELRGHRRTYIGAMPGRVISALNQCGCTDPVFLLDEVDKLSRDAHGDPASALLEVLDPEQNDHFRDHYIDAPVDLSHVMFITTANTTDTIDRALLDRMEVIELSSYTWEEKTQIAKRHLAPKELKNHGLKASQVRFTEAALKQLIDQYTREAGVRTLERLIAKICRKAALTLSEDENRKTVLVSPRSLEGFLGAPRYLRSPISEGEAVGVVNGLAWTQVGGEVMPVEALVLDGTGAVELTGKLGDVMKESAKIAHSTVRSQAHRLGLAPDYFKNHDLHVHVPEGAVPKDGPSAGVALTCAMMSAVTGIPARGGIAMTGEITLTGRVLPIGGVKEKLLAAYRMGVNNILLPRENGKDLEEIDAGVREQMNIHLIDRVEEAFPLVLTAPVEKPVKAERMRAV